MKNYPLLPINFNAWKNWTHTYLTEIDNKVYSLFHYVNYFVPDYYKQNIKDIVADIKTIPEDRKEYNNNIDISKLDYRGYVVVESEVYDILTKQFIHEGSRIISKAQSEGEQDLNTSVNRKNPQNYFIQPTGWASFYIPISNHAVPTNPEQGTEATDCLSFIYDAQAEEKYGLNLRFSIEWYPTRWYLDNIVTTSEYSGDGLVFSRNTTNRSISVQSTNGEKPIIRDLNGTEWLNGTDKRPMYSGFFGATNSEYGEEIIIDTIPSTATRFVETNRGVYTITLNKSTTHWPNSGLFLLY